MGDPNSQEVRELLWEWIAWEEGTINAVPMCMYLDDPLGYGSSVCWTGQRYTNEMLKKRIVKLKKELNELEETPCIMK